MLTIYNSLTQTKEEFKPLVEGKIGIYVCGITTYDYLHLGHARMLVAFDVVTRYLRARGFDVNYVRNITDIDDKILNRASENGELFSDLTDRFIEAMHEDEAALAVLPPDVEPRATGHIEEIVDMIKTLVEKDMAYKADNGDVYFSVMNFPDYGKLSKKKMDELLDGARIEVGELKKDPRDFVLWKSSPDDGVGWDSPWGYGRPGWHIECSAMSTCCLGDNFDIHGGGSDLLFPHHENEVAQSEAATGTKFANVDAQWPVARRQREDVEVVEQLLYRQRDSGGLRCRSSAAPAYRQPLPQPDKLFRTESQTIYQRVGAFL